MKDNSIEEKQNKISIHVKNCYLYSTAIVRKNQSILTGEVTNITEKGIGVQTDVGYDFYKWCNVLNINNSLGSD